MFLSSLQEFVKGCGNVTKRWVDGLLDKMTGGDHIKAVNQIRQVNMPSVVLYVINNITFHVWTLPSTK